MSNFHAGAHSFEIVMKKRCQYTEPFKETIVRSSNQFQHGIEFARICMDEQRGVVLRLPEDLGKTGTGMFDVTVLGSTHTDQYVAFVEDGGGGRFMLKAKDLVRADVVANWYPLSESMFSKHKTAFVGKEHQAADRRSDLFVATLRNHYGTTSKQKVFTLDGIGAFREAYMRGFADLTDGEVPKVYTFELDPVVTLIQQLLYGQATVIYTGALARDKFGYGCYGALSDSPPGIEYLITTRANSAGVINTLVTKEDCDAVVGLNLDFCGGILGGLDFEEAQRVLLNLLARLPHLVVLCLTFGKRQRAGLKYDFEKYARTPYGFRVEHTFDGPTDNKRVVSRVYVRIFDIPRTLHIPGGMWAWNMTKDKTLNLRSNAWKCVVKSIEPQTGAHILYSIDDDADDQVLTNLAMENLYEWTIEDKHVRTTSTSTEDEIHRLSILHDAMEAEHKATIRLIQEKMRTVKNRGSSTKTSIRKREYRCSKCGLPKKGHFCGNVNVLMPKKRNYDF